MADTVELQEAFKLFDMDGDGMITKDELRKLVEKVGGSMTEGEAKGLIHQADKDGNESIDFSEFSKLWAAIKGAFSSTATLGPLFGLKLYNICSPFGSSPLLPSGSSKTFWFHLVLHHVLSQMVPALSNDTLCRCYIVAFNIPPNRGIIFCVLTSVELLH